MIVLPCTSQRSSDQLSTHIQMHAHTRQDYCGYCWLQKIAIVYVAPLVFQLIVAVMNVTVRTINPCCPVSKYKDILRNLNIL